MKNLKKLEEIFLATASPEEKLTYENKKLTEKVSMLENTPPKEILKEVPVIQEVVKEVQKENTGEEIVTKINELEITPEKQIEFTHIKGFPWGEIKGLVKDMGNKLISWGMGGTWLNGQTTTNSHLTVSDTAPTNPEVNDLWYDVS